MISKINVLPIIGAHFGTFKERGNDNEGKYSMSDLWGFYGAPLIAAGILAYINFIASPNTINIIMISQTIFVPLLINVLVIVYGLIDGIKRRQIEATDTPRWKAIVARGTKRLEVLRQLYGSIAYTILISGCCLCTLAFYSSDLLPRWLLLLARLASHFLLIHLLLTSMMILKRFYLLMASEFEPDA